MERKKVGQTSPISGFSGQRSTGPTGEAAGRAREANRTDGQKQATPSQLFVMQQRKESRYFQDSRGPRGPAVPYSVVGVHHRQRFAHIPFSLALARFHTIRPSRAPNPCNKYAGMLIFLWVLLPGHYVLALPLSRSHRFAVREKEMLVLLSLYLTSL